MSGTNFRDYVMAMDRVEKRLLKVTKALDDAGIPYAVIGGNAVAAWVARVDPAATRTTVDVDLLVNRADDTRITDVMTRLGFAREDLRRLVLFTDPDEPSKRSGVHLVWAGALIRPSYFAPAPNVSESVRDPQGYRVLELAALVRMKLTSFRNIDQVHILDLLSVELIDENIRSQLTPPLLERLRDVERQYREEGHGTH